MASDFGRVLFGHSGAATRGRLRDHQCNYMIAGGKPLYFLDQIRRRCPCDASGSARNHIERPRPSMRITAKHLKALRDRLNPLAFLIICWTGFMPIIRMICYRCPTPGKRLTMSPGASVRFGISWVIELRSFFQRFNMSSLNRRRCPNGPFGNR